MATATYARFGKALTKALKDKDQGEATAATGISSVELGKSLSGEFLPPLEGIAALAKFAGVKPRVLLDAAIDDLSAANDNNDPHPKRAPASRSPMKPVNNW